MKLKKPYSDATWKKVLKLLRSGEAYRSIASRPGMPSRHAIAQKVSGNSKFAEAASLSRRKREGAQGFSKADMRQGHDDNTWDDVAKRLCAGVSISEISREPGMPAYSQIQYRRKFDPVFAARVPAIGKRSPRPSEEVWSEVLMLFHRGYTPYKICQMPGMPTRDRIRHKIKADQSFREIASRSYNPVHYSPDERVAAGRRKSKKYYDNHVRPLLEAQAEMCDTDTNFGHLVTAKNLKEIRRRMSCTQHQLAAELGVSRSMVSLWENSSPRSVCAAAKKAGARVAELLDLNGASARDRSANAGDLFAVVSKAVPRRLADDIRDDIISNIVMAVYDGTLRAEDIAKRAAEFVRAHHKEFSDYSTVTMEKQVGGDGYTLGNALGMY